MTIIVTPGSTPGDVSDMLDTLQAMGYGSDTEAQQLSMLNTSYRKVVGARRWWFLEVARDTSLVITAGNDSANLNNIEDFLHLEAVRLQANTNYYEPDFVRYQEWHTVAHADRIQGSPDFYTRNNNRILIWPKAREDYTLVVDYIKHPGQLVNPTDAVVIPETYRDVVLWDAVAQMSLRQREMDMHQLATSRYDELMQLMAQQDTMRQRHRSSQVISSGELDDVSSYLEPGGYVLS